MGLIDQYCTDAVTITPKSTVQVDAQYDDGTPVVTTGRVVHKSGAIIDANKMEWRYSLIVYLRASETIALQDKVTVDGTVYHVMSLREADAIGGAQDHYKVWCG